MRKTVMVRIIHNAHFTKLLCPIGGYSGFYAKISVKALTYHQLAADGCILCVCTGECSGSSEQGSGLCQPAQSRQSPWIPAGHGIAFPSATGN